MSQTASSPTASPPLSPPLSGPSSPILSRRVQHRRGSSSAADPWGNHLDLRSNDVLQTDDRTCQPDASDPARRAAAVPSASSTLRPRRPLPEFAEAAPRKPRPPRREGRRDHAHELRLGLLCSARIILGVRDATGKSHPRPASPYFGAEAAPFGGSTRVACSLVVQPAVCAHLAAHPWGSLTAAPGACPRLVHRHSGWRIPSLCGSSRALFTSPQPGARLFALLAQIFPPQSAPEPPMTDESVFATDPRQWSSAQLEYWVKQVDRDVASDEVWVGLVRRCILYRSELIWE